MAEEKKLLDLMGSIEKLSISDALGFVKIWEEKHGPIAMAAAAGPAVAAEAAEEKTEFEVLLVAAGAKKIDIMKLVRTLTQKSLGEAKSFVESASEAEPNSLGTFGKDEANKLADELKAAGATVKVA